MNKYALYAAGVLSWCALGFKRGVNSYKYSCEKRNKTFFYSVQMVHGISGAVFYISPFPGVVMLHKELYRLEVNLRNLEDEKKTDYYNELL